MVTWFDVDTPADLIAQIQPDILVKGGDWALDKIVGAIQTISETAIRIADITAQQSGAVSEIRDHSERIHQLGGDNLLRIGQGREQGENLLVLGGQLHTAVQAFRV